MLGRNRIFKHRPWLGNLLKEDGSIDYVLNAMDFMQLGEHEIEVDVGYKRVGAKVGRASQRLMQVNR